MYRRIMVPLDGTAFSEQALAAATSLARAAGSTLVLVTVETPPHVTVPVTQLREPLREIELEYLGEVADRLREAGVSEVSVAVLTGNAPSALEAHRKVVEADLTVMSTHGHGPLARAWLGSVADQFVRMTEAPVLMVRPETEREEVDLNMPAGVDRVLVPVDGSPLSSSAVAPALMMGGLFGARATLARLVEYPRRTESAYLPDAVLAVEQTLEEGRQAAEVDLDALIEQLGAEGHDVSREVRVVAHIAEGILKLADEISADMIVMASHGRGGLERLVLGSVTDKVLRGAEVPVLIVPPATD